MILSEIVSHFFMMKGPKERNLILSHIWSTGVSGVPGY